MSDDNEQNASAPFAKRTSNESKKSNSDPGVTTRNWSRKAKVQTRAMCSNAKPSSALLAAKKKAQSKKKNFFESELRDHFQTAMDSKNLIKGPVELVLDERMLEHKCLWDPNYPECPERLSSIIKRIKEYNLIDRCVIKNIKMATKDDILILHSESVYNMLLSTDKSTDIDNLEQISSKFDAVYIHPATHELALLAVGGTIQIVENVIKGEAQSGMALVRPPGHHAMRSEPCGYCFYNNVAFAARHALTNMNVQRILIVDWDVHHGQATQQMFYDDPRVVYFSIHRYENGLFWPNLRQSNFNYIGIGDGLGYNFNVPLNSTKMQDSDYIAIWHQLLLPMALEFSPELLICSAGYDSALGDEKGEMELTPACFAHLTHMLMGICSKIVVVLEGGYCLESLSESAALTLKTLLGDPVPPMVYYTPPSQSIKETILNCMYVHKPYWNCYNYQPTYSTDSTVLNISNLSDEKHVVKLEWLGSEDRADHFETRDCYPIQEQSFIDEICRKLSHLRIVTDVSTPVDRVCYVYDEIMLKHKNIHEADHPERPERISRIYNRLQDWKLLKRMHKLNTRIATVEELELAHSTVLLNSLQNLSSSTQQMLYSHQEKYDSIYFHKDSYECACVAAGCVLQVVDSVLEGNYGSGLCIVRPPGHHASEDLPCGFCLFNNVGVAAKYALSSHSLKRILILDWDVHHGNGTQSMFYDDNRVMYISLHRYDYGTFFPSSTDANYTEVGTSNGIGFNINIPWNKRGMGDKEYLAAFTQIILPIAYEFNPELVLISAGFDACVGDPLGGCRVTPECFGQLTHWLSSLARGKVILCLEGGYNVNSISFAMAMCAKALLGDPIVSNYESITAPHPSAIDSINDVIRVHKKYWKNLAFQVALPKENILPSPVPSRGLITVQENIVQSEKFDSTDQDIYYDCSDSVDYLKKSSLPTSPEKSKTNELKDSLTTNEIELSLKDTTVVISPKDHITSVDISAGASTSKSSESSIEPKTLTVFLAENMDALINEEMFAVVPLDYCPHVDEIENISTEILSSDFTQKRQCFNCEHKEEIWVCLHCKLSGCGRYINGHMLQHFESTKHSLVLSLTDLSVWCSSCEAYIDNPSLYPYKNCAHIEKFGEKMPWTYTAQ